MVGPSPPSSSATRLQTRRRLDLGADAARAGEGDEIDIRMTHERRADEIAVEHVHRAGRRAGIDEQLGDLVHDARRLRRRLQHDGVAGRERRRHLVAGQVERRVERRDAGHHSDRKAQQEGDLAGTHGAAVERHLLALDADRLLRRQLHGVLRSGDLAAAVLDGLAGLARHHLGDLVDALVEQHGNAPQQLGALVARHRRHHRLGARRRRPRRAAGHPGWSAAHGRRRCRDRDRAPRRSRRQVATPPRSVAGWSGTPFSLDFAEALHAHLRHSCVQASGSPQPAAAMSPYTSHNLG